MVTISEWLPNPQGKDSDGEWLELVNRSDTPVNLSGWYVTTGGTKKYLLSGNINAGEYKVILRGETGFSLRNTDGELSLFNPRGAQVDSTSFVGVAPEGKSAERLGATAFFTDPTPGSPFTGNPYANILSATYPRGVTFGNVLRGADVVLLMLGAAIAFSAALLYIAKHYDYISELFFPKN